MVLKRKLARRSWPIEAFVGAVFKRRGGDSLGMGRGFKSAGKELEFRFEKATNFGTIGPRSRRDRATIIVLIARRSASDRLEAIPPLKLPDCGSIAPRSRSDRTAIVEFFH